MLCALGMGNINTSWKSVSPEMLMWDLYQEKASKFFFHSFFHRGKFHRNEKNEIDNNKECNIL